MAVNTIRERFMVFFLARREGGLSINLAPSP
jgi:hypothetical protein